MECEIVIRYFRTPFFRCIARGVVKFKSEIKTQNKEIEIGSQTQAVTACYLFIKLIEPKNAIWLIGILFYRPNISLIDKHGALQQPKNFNTLYAT